MADAADVNVNVDPFTGHEEKCLSLYQRAHESQKAKYSRIISKMRSHAQKARNGNDNDSAQAWDAHATDIEAVKNKSDFTDWFNEDRVTFSKMDADHNGHLDFEEYKNFVKKNFEMSGHESKEAFKKWDVDEGKSVGVYEYCQMMAIWHGEFELHKQQMQAEAIINTMAGAVPCSCCGGCCIEYSCKFGLLCSLCTLGLSWIPCWCIARATAANLEDQDKMDEECKKAKKEAVKHAKESTKKVILAGPATGLLSPTDCAKNPAPE
jgi:hypothetical protein